MSYETSLSGHLFTADLCDYVVITKRRQETSQSTTWQTSANTRQCRSLQLQSLFWLWCEPHVLLSRRNRHHFNSLGKQFRCIFLLHRREHHAAFSLLKKDIKDDFTRAWTFFTFQLAGVATFFSAVNFKESITRKISLTNK
eukprot:m.234873 g.234873  ORF g.234873 m.234873 type:complete len:141 (+) comp40122_c0_seq4:567-989(+)